MQLQRRFRLERFCKFHSSGSLQSTEQGMSIPYKFFDDWKNWENTNNISHENTSVCVVKEIGTTHILRLHPALLDEMKKCWECVSALLSSDVNRNFTFAKTQNNKKTNIFEIKFILEVEKFISQYWFILKACSIWLQCAIRASDKHWVLPTPKAVVRHYSEILLPRSILVLKFLSSHLFFYKVTIADYDMLQGPPCLYTMVFLLTGSSVSPNASMWSPTLVPQHSCVKDKLESSWKDLYMLENHWTDVPSSVIT